MTIKQNVQNRLEQATFERRPVTKADKWCRIKSVISSEDLLSDAPYGYIIVIPKYYNYMNLKVNGVILRSKCIKGKLHLQVVERSNRKYATVIKQSKREKKDFLNIRNLEKI